MPNRFFGNYRPADRTLLAGGFLLVASLLFLPVALGVREEVDCIWFECTRNWVSSPDPFALGLDFTGIAVGIGLMVLSRITGRLGPPKGFRAA